MINNNKGAILVVTIVCMMILTIIGYITLQMTSSQGIIDTYDQAQARTEYVAEGMVERARGYIDHIIHNSFIAGGDLGDVGDNPANSGVLYSRVTSHHGKWDIFNDDIAVGYGNNGEVDIFDNSMYPEIRTSVWCEFVPNATESSTWWKDELDRHDITDVRTFVVGDDIKTWQTYRIVCVASSTVKGAAGVGLIVSTVTYYFHTNHTVDETHKNNTEIRYMAWRKEI